MTLHKHHHNSEQFASHMAWHLWIGLIIPRRETLPKGSTKGAVPRFWVVVESKKIRSSYFFQDSLFWQKQHPFKICRSMYFRFCAGKQFMMAKKKTTAGDLNYHADVQVQWVLHHSLMHIQGFTRSNWMPLLGKYSRHIDAPSGWSWSFIFKKNTKKSYLWLANLLIVKLRNGVIFLPVRDFLLTSSN